MSKKAELEQQGFKSYENDAICVFWNPKMCQHTGLSPRAFRERYGQGDVESS